MIKLISARFRKAISLGMFLLVSCSLLSIEQSDGVCPEAEDKGEQIALLAQLDCLLEYSQSLETSAPDSAFYFARKALLLSRETGSTEMVANALKQNGYIHYYALNQYDSALVYFDQAEEILIQLKDTLQLLKLNRFQGRCLHDISQNDLAIKKHLDIVELARVAGDKKRLILNLMDIGDIYRELNDSERAVRYLEEAQMTASNQVDIKTRGAVAHNLSLAYESDGQIDLAIRMMKDVLENREEYGVSTGSPSHNLGRYYNIKNNQDSAFYYLNKTLEIDDWMSIPRKRGVTFIELGAAHVLNGDIRRAISFYKKAYDISEQITLDKLTRGASSNLAICYEQIGNVDSALYFNNVHTEVYARIFNQQQKAHMIEMDAIYTLQQKDKEILTLEVSKARVEKERTTMALLLGFLAVIATLSVVIYSLILKKKRQHAELIETELKLKEAQIESSEQQLRGYSALVTEKNQIIEDIEGRLEEAGYSQQQKATKIAQLQAHTILTDDDWQSFKLLFDQAYPGFLLTLKTSQPDLTRSEVRISALMKLQLENQEMADLLGISVASVSKTKYRLKKKLGAMKSSELQEFVNQI